MPERVVPSTSPSRSGSARSTDKQGQAPAATDLGKRVLFQTSGAEKKERYGTLRYWGTPEFAPGLWCGIELDEPTGKNNGSVHGIRYFNCSTNYGLFVPLGRVELDTRPFKYRLSPLADRQQRKTSTNSKISNSPFFYNTLPRSSSIPAVNTIGTNRSATLSYRRSENKSNSSAVKVGLGNASKKQIGGFSPKKISDASPLSIATKHKFSSEANIREKLQSTGSPPVTGGLRKYRKPLASYSDATDCSISNESLRTATSCIDVNQLSCSIYDDESDSRYSSASDISTNYRIPSDSDVTPHSSSASPDFELCLLTNEADNAFLLPPNATLGRTMLSPDTSPVHKPVGLSTAATNLLESIGNGKLADDYRGPSPTDMVTGQHKKYQNYTNGCTLAHPLNSTHKPFHEETLQVQSTQLSSKEHSSEIGTYSHRNQYEPGLYSNIKQYSCQEECHTKKLDDSQEIVQSTFQYKLQKAQESYMKQMEDVQLLYRKKVEEISLKYAQEIHQLVKENCDTVNNLKKDIYGDRLSQD